MNVSFSRLQLLTLLAALALTLVLVFTIGMLIGRMGGASKDRRPERQAVASSPSNRGVEAQAEASRAAESAGKWADQPSAAAGKTASSAPPNAKSAGGVAGQQNQELTFYRSLPQPLDKQLGITPEGAASRPGGSDLVEQPEVQGTNRNRLRRETLRETGLADATAGRSQESPQKRPTKVEPTTAPSLERQPRILKTKGPSASKLLTKPEIAPPPTDAVAPGSTRAPSRREGFEINVGSFKQERNALKLVSNLQRKGYRAYILATELSGRGVFHRVRIGPFISRAEAEKTAVALRRRDKLPARVISPSLVEKPR